MKGKNLKKALVNYSIVVLIFSTVYAGGVLNNTTNSDFYNLNTAQPSSNIEMLLSVFDTKNSDYATYGYYPQIYSGSLQATYYALYILDAIGKLGDIDQHSVINYIISFYNSSTSQFTDENSNRYLASKIPGRYYPCLLYTSPSPRDRS